MNINKPTLLKFVSLAILTIALQACDYLPKKSVIKLTDTQKQTLVASASFADEKIVSLFQQHDLVAIGDAHFYDDVMSYTTNLVTSDSFVEQCQHIIVEFGNARYQALLNDYLAGQEVSETELKKIWQDTLFFTAWTPTVYADFFKQVRAFNMNKPPEKQLKVTLAESPFDWQQLETSEQWQQLADNKVSGFVNQTVQAVNPGDKALLIFGAFHTIKLDASITSNLKIEQTPFVTRLKQAGYNTYAIWPVIQQGMMATLSAENSQTPSLLDVNNSDVHSLEFADIFPKARVKLSQLNARHATIGELFDGMLYLGKIERQMQFPKALLKDDEFINKAQQRVKLIGGRVETKFNDILEESKRS